MIRSMTGFGTAVVETKALRASVTVRSRNHRFLDVTLQLPQRLQALEADTRQRVKAAVGRGHVEVSLQAALPQGGGAGTHPAAGTGPWPGDIRRKSQKALIRNGT